VGYRTEEKVALPAQGSGDGLKKWRAPRTQSGAETGPLPGFPSPTFRSEMEPEQVVCLGPEPMHHLQLSRFTAEACIDAPTVSAGLRTGSAGMGNYSFLPSVFM